MNPFRISVNAEGPPGTRILDNVRANAGAALLEPQPPHDGRLAVVGGGPSLQSHLEELRDWMGEIWAINGTCAYLHKQGIKSRFFTVDAYLDETPEQVDADLEGVEEAYLSTSCIPDLFRRLPKALAFHSHDREPQGLYAPGGTTSAMRAQVIALLRGFHDISYFGCEGSWPAESASHAFKNVTADALVVRAGEVDYITSLQFMLQSQELSNVIRAFPDVFKDRSGGLLAAMIAHPDTWEVVALSGPLNARLDTERIPYQPRKELQCLDV